jgi:hypothetical protein
MNRTAFLAASATLAAAGGSVAAAQTVPGGTHLVERKADFDADAFAAVVGRDAQIRQVVEAIAFKPGVWNNVKNVMNGLQFGFGYPANAILVAFAPHGPSAAYGYSDYLWKKYRIGEFHDLKDATGAPVTSNSYVAKRAPADTSADPDDDKGMYQDTSIETLQARGLIFMMCHTAVEEQARNLVKRGFAPAGMTGSQVAADMLTHLIPGAIVVPSMVATIAVLQAVYHYTYLTLTL